MFSRTCFILVFIVCFIFSSGPPDLFREKKRSAGFTFGLVGGPDIH